MSKRNVSPLGITQVDLEKFDQIAVDRSEVGKQYDALKAELIAKLQAGAPIQEGVLTIELGESGRKFPDWKHEFIRANGEAAAQAVIDGTEEKPIYTVDVHRRSRFVR